MKATDIFNMAVQSGLFAVLLGLAVSGVKCAKTAIDAKTLEATQKIKDANVKNAITTGEDCITTVVAEMAQTTAEDLKAKSADGKLTAEDAAQIKADAIAKVQALLNDDVCQTLDTVFGDGEAWIKSKIEAAVKMLKGDTASKARQTVNIAPVIKTTAQPVNNAATESAVAQSDTADIIQTVSVQ